MELKRPDGCAWCFLAKLPVNPVSAAEQGLFAAVSRTLVKSDPDAFRQWQSPLT
jgi:hypothetical protein